MDIKNLIFRDGDAHGGRFGFVDGSGHVLFGGVSVFYRNYKILDI